MISSPTDVNKISRHNRLLSTITLRLRTIYTRVRQHRSGPKSTRIYIYIYILVKPNRVKARLQRGPLGPPPAGPPHQPGRRWSRRSRDTPLYCLVSVYCLIPVYCLVSVYWLLPQRIHMVLARSAPVPNLTAGGFSGLLKGIP